MGSEVWAPADIHIGRTGAGIGRAKAHISERAFDPVVVRLPGCTAAVWAPKSVWRTWRFKARPNPIVGLVLTNYQAKLPRNGSRLGVPNGGGNPLRGFGWVLMLPDSDREPSVLKEDKVILLITLDVSRDLLGPVVGIASR